MPLLWSIISIELFLMILDIFICCSSSSFISPVNPVLFFVRTMCLMLLALSNSMVNSYDYIMPISTHYLYRILKKVYMCWVAYIHKYIHK